MGEKTALMSLYSFLALLSFSVLGHTAAASAEQKWREIKPVGAGYRIDFPAAPKTEWKDLPSESGTVPVMISLLSRDDGMDFMAMYSKFPTGSFPNSTQIELDRLRNSSVLAVRGELRSEATLSVSGAPARLIVVAFHGGESIATVLFVLDGTRLYQAMCIAPDNRKDDPDVRHFIDSLALVPR
jgi:hypothetical protein